ncbi:MAG: tRNA threonylcarbamoyladenosine dehydratase [Bacteroidales bacterium]|nr:tRNA threonylcarbamoyladenosine dehydratase [Bacteroidales bacterium]
MEKEIDNWYQRTEMALGKEAVEKLRSASVLVVGLGGVGAWAAEMICRAGVGTMTIVDGDTVNSTNRNRQLLALKSTEGRSKAVIMGERLLDINPELKLTIVNEFLRDERLREVVTAGYDYVVDAIDTLSPKTFLISTTLNHGMPLVSSMGAGGRLDPHKVIVADISETYNCSLARVVRKRLAKLGIRQGFRAVFSPEDIEKERVVATDGEIFKASAVGTISYMPAAFGIACASVVIRDLTGR